MQVLSFTTFAQHISDYLVKEQIIDEHRQSLYTFGISQMMDMMLNVVTAVLIAVFFRMIPQVILFTVAYINIRRYAGGYHAKTRQICYIYSSLMIVAALALINILTNYWQISLTVAAITGAIIFILAPVEHKNKPLRENEKKVYRQRARIFTGCELLIAVIAGVTKLPMFSAVVATAFLMLCIMLLAGKGYK